MVQETGEGMEPGADPGSRYVVVSSDSHVGPSVEHQLRGYCESKYLDEFDKFVAEMKQHGQIELRSSEASKDGEENYVLRAGDSEAAEAFGKKAGVLHATQVDPRFLQRQYDHSIVAGLQDADARHADMDAHGVAADVIFHGGLNGQSVPFSTTGLVSWGSSSYDNLEPVGVRAYNRWLADFVSSAPERHVGIAHIPISDPEACVREVEWAAEAGLKGINMPAPRGDIPMFNEKVWEPLWAACAATEMPLHTHGGGGEHYPYQGNGALEMYSMETLFRTRRGIWVLIFGGVFKRHPALRLVITEQWVNWAPDVIADMDGLYFRPSGAMIRQFLPEPPSAYFRRNCFIGASFMSNGDAKLGIEHDLVRNLMWGDDYPHAEGVWPYTRESVQFAFHDIAPDVTRKYLGGNAIDLYGLDRDKLQAIADRIGPSVEDLSTPFEPSEELIGASVGSYAFRTGPGKYV